MKLSSELFHQVTRSFAEGSAQGPLDINERADGRVGLVGRAIIIPCPARCGRQPISVAVRDLSATGLGVIHNQRLEAGEQFILRLPPTPRDPAGTAVLCAVIHCRPVALGVYAIGARFTSLLRSSSPNSTAGDSTDDPATMHVGSLADAFREQAASGLTAEEYEQLRQVEERLSRLQTQ